RRRQQVLLSEVVAAGGGRGVCVFVCAVAVGDVSGFGDDGFRSAGNCVSSDLAIGGVQGGGAYGGRIARLDGGDVRDFFPWRHPACDAGPGGGIHRADLYGGEATASVD